MSSRSSDVSRIDEEVEISFRPEDKITTSSSRRGEACPSTPPAHESAVAGHRRAAMPRNSSPVSSLSAQADAVFESLGMGEASPFAGLSKLKRGTNRPPACLSGRQFQRYCPAPAAPSSAPDGAPWRPRNGTSYVR